MFRNDEIKHTRILVIDDEVLNLSILEELLEGSGYPSIDCEASPRVGINLYQNNDYDLVLLDLSMPDIDGFGVLGNRQQITHPPYWLFYPCSNHLNRYEAHGCASVARSRMLVATVAGYAPLEIV